MLFFCVFQANTNADVERETRATWEDAEKTYSPVARVSCSTSAACSPVKRKKKVAPVQGLKKHSCQICPSMSVCNETKPGWRHLEAVLEVSLRGGSLVRVWEKFFWRRSPHSARRMGCGMPDAGCGMRDAGSVAKKIFPELAQVSLLAGYKHREGLGQDEEWGGAGGMESSLSSSSPCSFFPVIPRQWTLWSNNRGPASTAAPRARVTFFSLEPYHRYLTSFLTY